MPVKAARDPFWIERCGQTFGGWPFPSSAKRFCSQASNRVSGTLASKGVRGQTGVHRRLRKPSPAGVQPGLPG